MSTTIDNFDWMDEPAKKPGPPKGRPLSPEHLKALAKPGRKRDESKGRLTHGKKRLADGTIAHFAMTETKWQKAIQLISNGVLYGELWKKLNISKQTFNAYLITNVAAHKQMREAKLLWLRRDFHIEEVEELLSVISMGNTLKASAKDMGWTDNKVASFYNLVRNDSVMREVYDEARKLQAESWLDDTIDIADDKTADRYTDDKGNERVNHEVIQRSKLRIDQRNWASGVLNRKRFGDHKHVDVNGSLTVNHAVLLSSARRRLETVHKQRGVTVESEATEVDRSGAQK